MKQSTDNALFAKKVAIAVSIALALWLLMQLLLSTAHIFSLFFISLLLALPLRSATNYVVQKTKLPDVIAYTAVMLAILLFFVIMVLLIGPEFSEQWEKFTAHVPESLSQLDALLKRYTGGRFLQGAIPTISDVGEKVGTNAMGIFSQLTGFVSGTLQGIGFAIIMLFTAIYFSIGPKVYMDGFLSLLPPSKRGRIKEAITLAAEQLNLWLLTRLVSVVANGIMTYIGLMALGMPFALSLALLNGLLSFIPTFGPIIAAVLALLIAFTEGPMMFLYVAALYLIIEIIDNHLISPLMQSYTLYTPPAVVLVSQVLLGVLIGRLGLVIAAPLVAALMPIIRLLYIEDILEGPRTHNKNS